MIRTQISLDENDMRRLRALAHERHVSIAALLRESVDALLTEAEHREVRNRALRVIGMFDSGIPNDNAGEDHDEIVASAILKQ